MTVIDDAKNKVNQAKQKLGDIEKGIANVGFNLLGITAPLLAPRWTATEGDNLPTEEAEAMSLKSEDEWVAPAPGVLSVEGGADRIVFADGSFAQVAAKVSVFRLQPQVHLRLLRLYASFLESRADDLVVRQVPYFFVYRGATKADSAASGAMKVGEPLGLTNGLLSIHDRNGLPIDPVAVAAAFDALLTNFTTLEPRAQLSAPPIPIADRQLHRIANAASSAAPSARLRLVDPYGQPLKDAATLQNLTAIATAAGIFGPTVAATAITKATTAPVDLRFGPATHGTLSTSFTLPPNPKKLTRDFFSLMVVDLEPFLIGGRPADDVAAAVEARPEIRHQETLNFSIDGATALGAVTTILGGTPTDALAVAPVIRSDFALPEDASPAKSQWPAFPAPASSNTAPISGNLAAAFAPEAHFVDAHGGPGADVALTLHGLQVGQAVRVYNRVFLTDAREGRGNGAGGVVVDATGALTLILQDPLGLVPRGATEPTTLPAPADATLHVDVVVVNAAGKARVFGNVVAPVAGPQPAPILPAVANALGAAAVRRGIAPAGILGLTGPALPPVTDPVALALALSGEGDPRQAPRLPTMARREAVVASGTVSGTTKSWKAQLSGAHLVPGMQNARHRTGSPGSPGGPEFQTVAVDTAGGLLAYDLARAALRRTSHLLPRLLAVENDRWKPPAAATAGTISGALLQTVSAIAETPELEELEAKKGRLKNLPGTWKEVVAEVLPDLPDNLPDIIRNALEKLKKDFAESPNGARLYEEFKRDFCASVHGRRDALWALRHALVSARELIYLEGPSFTSTDYDKTASADLVAAIAARMAAAPGLRVVLALPKELDYGPGYEAFAAREYARRMEAVNRLRAVDADRVVVFHPIGFPGRPLRLMTNVIIVDDVWAMLGASTFRRRGLTFDGSLDLVMFDNRIRAGRSLALADLRRRLMSGHLGVAAPVAGTTPHATWVRLADLHSAFAACQELLAHGGSGLISPLWNGIAPGREPTDPAPLLRDDVADPDGRNFSGIVLLLLEALKPAGIPPLQP